MPTLDSLDHHQLLLPTVPPVASPVAVTGKPRLSATRLLPLRRSGSTLSAQRAMDSSCKVNVNGTVKSIQYGFKDFVPRLNYIKFIWFILLQGVRQMEGLSRQIGPFIHWRPRLFSASGPNASDLIHVPCRLQWVELNKLNKPPIKIVDFRWLWSLGGFLVKRLDCQDC